MSNSNHNPFTHGAKYLIRYKDSCYFSGIESIQES